MAATRRRPKQTEMVRTGNRPSRSSMHGLAFLITGSLHFWLKQATDSPGVAQDKDMYQVSDALSFPCS